MSMAMMRGKLKTGKKSRLTKLIIMKKMTLLLTAIFCIHFLFAQTSSKVPEESGGWPDCPMGCNSVVNFTVTTLNFHKPRTGCESGFGFCIKAVWTQRCDCDIFKPITSITNDKVNCIARVEQRQLYLYIPRALKKLDAYKNEETGLFTVEEGIRLSDANGKEFASLVAGEYRTRLEGENFLVIIPLK